MTLKFLWKDPETPANVPKMPKNVPQLKMSLKSLQMLQNFYKCFYDYNCPKIPTVHVPKMLTNAPNSYQCPWIPNKFPQIVPMSLKYLQMPEYF